ncbi:MAG: HEAT repeat domain-containing protein [Sandaracinaceae bacterium]
MSNPPYPGDHELETLPELEGESTVVSTAPPAQIPPPAATPQQPVSPRPAPQRPAPQRPGPQAPSTPSARPPQPLAPSPFGSAPPGSPFGGPPPQGAPPSPFSQPPQGAAPSPFAQEPPRPAPQPALPAGLVQKTKKGGGFFGKTMAGTVMGTMVFLAKSKRIPTGVRVASVLLVVGGVAAAIAVFWTMRARDQANAQLEAALARPDGAGVAQVRALAEEGLEDPSMVRAIEYLGALRDGPSVPILEAALEESPEVQRAAAAALAEIGPPAAQPAADALAARLSSEDELVRDHAAWALVRLGDARGVEAILAALSAGSMPSIPSYDPYTLADVMEHEGLLAAAGHDSANVRQLAAFHLGDHCAPSDEPALARLAGDDDASVANAATVTLARCDMGAAAAQVQAGLGAHPDRWNALYTQMRDSVGAPGLALLLPHAPNAGAHRTMVHEIATSMDPRAPDVLVAELARLETPSAQDRFDVARALAAESDPRLVEVLEPMLASEERDHAALAMEMLGTTERAEDVEARLLPLLRTARERRAMVLAALADAGVCTEGAQRAMTPHLTRGDARAQALRALGGCGHERALELAREEVGAPLRAPITQSQGELRLAALEVVAARGQEDLAPALFEQLEDPDTEPRVRSAIADALGVLASDALRDRAVDRMTDPSRPRAVREAALRVLRFGVAASSVPRLVGFVRGGEDDERTRQAAIVLGLAHHAGSRAELTELLDDERARRSAAVALSLDADEASARALAAQVTAEDAVQAASARGLQETPWIFAAGDAEGDYADLGAAVRLRDAGYAAPLSRLCETMVAEEDGLARSSLLERRRRFRSHLTESGDAATRALAAEGLACAGARGALLAVRDAGGVGADEARAVLLRR